ncbi:MAG: hypothetical protein AAGI44_11885 [Pseudomonadota bacterium]
MESLLREIRANNIEKSIWPSENKVIGRLLDRPTEMRPIYEEIASKLNENQQRHLWDGLLSVAAFWNPEVSRELRDTKKKLLSINKEIVRTARTLSSLIKEREELCEASGVTAYEDYHPVHWLHRAGYKNYLYESYVKIEIEKIRGQFDLKYWPESYDVLSAIADFAEGHEVYENDSRTRTLLSSPKHSMADHLRVLLKMIEDKKDSGPPHYLLPSDFRLSDSAIATIINCSLDLAPEDLLTAEGIKRSRQNIRKRRLPVEATD